MTGWRRKYIYKHNFLRKVCLMEAFTETWIKFSTYSISCKTIKIIF